ncbi:MULTISPECIES: DUF3703 domain-containing protein [Pseudomonadaceae]|jgi:hypothetical protein|uniref:DUF3703 domain-containing protein n=2 Tax=Pseudomonadaceae TaxID=135621 RepID=A0AA42IXK0_9GAMM|nr:MULTISPECIES: DUF3703 domain-containing protein [Pseudomonas]PKM33077.1 MAG: hypothetical protein CVV08_08655 [Gammaproteobacteria bacterium HGW-Gammaproteobacteria-12]MBA4682379.1 DUF3703 domain-containing protein [Pseudomonas sp.]MBG0843475.1 DUF3703 domain-containing protein [Pseudomonas toyotomiensis]MBG0848438.1 DUF3703 domain-containing protein [Pseudomonas chengduensis]MBZ9668049.1 DUF3703 domain-containing protein [Pseudomonas chaetocerotis]
MSNEFRAAIDESFLSARQALGAKSPKRAYPWLERAHILTQRMPLLHAYSHWLTFLAGWEERDYREMLGQAARIPAALLFSKIWVPLGNTGRARVSAFQPMPVSDELKQLLRDSQ